ncbi:TonB-dependent receptor plug domain-containing protein [Spirosoma telluris]|uniref:TonB-dependent receptor plug domain-containing protein n=1 Tax=Spirosoma telluris TaxID=2183553 RepID=UPI002FC39700
MYVRGGNVDQNLILLDDAPVYNAYHLLGFFSTFNSDAIKDLTLYKGSAPAQYGGRLSSVIDIKMNEGNNKKVETSGGIGLISSHLNVEGPIVKDKGSLLVTARRTYADLFLKLSSSSTLSNNTLYFYDMNAKANYRLNAKNQVFLSGYLGRDVLGFGSTFGLNWGNSTATFRWNHLLNEKTFSNTSLIFSDYSYKISNTSGSNDFSITSRIRDWNFKQELQFFPNPANAIKLGLNSIYHTVTPGQVSGSTSTGATPPTLQDRYGLENALYASNDWKATTRLNVSYGLRLSSFSLLGAGDFYGYDADGNVVSTQTYTSGQVVKSYLFLEPRISASFMLNDVSSLKASYTRNTQNMHIVSNSTSSNPTDLWIMSSNNVKPQIADQVALGYFRNLADNRFEFSTETYYKKLQNQIDLRQGPTYGPTTKSRASYCSALVGLTASSFYSRRKQAG